MAVSTSGTYLMYKATGEATSYTKLCDIVDYPDLGGTPSKLDTTDLSAQKFKTSILGLQETPDLTFTANYDKTVYATIAALNKSYPFELQFGTDGADGKYDWTGKIQVYVNGGGVDEVRKMTIVLSAETEITAAS